MDIGKRIKSVLVYSSIIVLEGLFFDFVGHQYIKGVPIHRFGPKSEKLTNGRDF